MTYNPIMRTFAKLRTVLLAHSDLPRSTIRPSTQLAILAPVLRQPAVWRALGKPSGWWPGEATALYGPHPKPSFWARFLGSITSPPPFMFGMETVGDLVIHLTHFPDHAISGYRWTRNEIALKVRLLIAESLGLPLSRIQPETRFFDFSVD